MNEDKPKVKLNPKRELFCQYFASDREFFGNGVQSYMAAYGIDPTDKSAYRGAMQSAYELLRNPDITARINELLDGSGLNDANVDKQLLLLVNQNADLPTKRAAIGEYNKLKARITQQTRSEVTQDITATVAVVADPDLAAGFADYLKAQTSVSE